MRHDAERGLRLRRLFVSLLAAVLGLSAGSPVWASEPEGGRDAAHGGGAQGEHGLRLLEEKFPVPDAAVSAGITDTASQAFWTWPEGGRAFFLGPNSESGFERLVAVDLANGAELGYRQLVPRAWNGGENEGGGHPGQPHTVALDRAGGRLFVAYRQRHTVQAINNRDETLARMASGEGLCGSMAHDSSAGCFMGVHVLDAMTLESLGQMPLAPLRTDGILPTPQLLDLRWSPPRGEGDAGKLHALVADYSHSHYWTPQAGTPGNPRANTAGLTYLVQFDPASMRQEWAVRLDACRGGRETRDQEQMNITAGMPYPAAVLRRASLEDPAMLVACHTSFSTQQVAVVTVPLDEQGSPATLPVATRDPGAMLNEVAEGGREPSPPVFATAGQGAVFGPDKVFQMIADPVSQRILFKVLDGAPTAEVWWVYDGKVDQFIATIGIGSPVDWHSTAAGLDPDTGRFYVIGRAHTAAGASWPGGLYTVDIRRTPVPQALVFPQFAEIAPKRVNASHSPLMVAPSMSPDLAPRIYVSSSHYGAKFFHILEDRMPAGAVIDGGGGFGGRTLDIDEAEGATAATLDGAARGYGARVLLVGGAEAASRLGPVDPIGLTEECNSRWTTLAFNDLCGFAGVSSSSPCSAMSRDVALAFVGPEGPAVVDATGARGGAEPVVVDSATRADMDAAASRCSGEDWDRLWSQALFGAAPVAEPKAPWLFSNRSAQCVSGSDVLSDEVGDSVSGRFSARVDCADEEASGHAYARGLNVEGVGITEALSSFRIYRDPGRGVVARVESVVRGVSVDGILRIDSVRGTAESWANGRRQPVPGAERETGYDPNCDHERTAGSCFVTHVFGMWTPGYSCGPCGDEEVLADRMTRALGANGAVRFRRPDPALARGAENGFIAAVQKADSERFGDLVLNNDLLQTIVPAVEIIRYAPPNRPLSRGGPRGRQIVQLAGVEVSSSYSIQCLLVYDEATNTCGAAPEELGSISVILTDPEATPLAGGAFEVRRDTDADGVVGLVDELLREGACVTGDDGIGTCTFDNLQPGAYLVSQTSAPPGYAAVAEPWVSEVAGGEARTVTFVNASNLSTIEVSAEDADGKPLEGATFAVFPDTDGDGKGAAHAQPVGQCTTDASGTCSMQVPVGSYVLVQTAVPGGLEPIEPLAFVLTAGGQTAAVGVVNYALLPPETPAPAPAPARVDYSNTPAFTPTEDVAVYEPPTTIDEPTPSVAEQVGGTVVRLIRAPADAMRLLTRDLQQALAWTVSLLLFALAAMAVRRRGLLARLSPAVTAGGPIGGVPGGPSGGRSPSRGASAGVLAVAAAAVQGGSGSIAGATTTPHATRIAVAVNSAGVRALVKERLVSVEDCQIVAMAESLNELRRVLPGRDVDVLVVDLALEPGVDMFEALDALHPHARTVGLIPPGHRERELARRGFVSELGSLLIIADDLGNGNLRYVVRQVAAGKRCYGPTAQTILADCFLQSIDARDREEMPYLTDRELEVARLAACGLRSEIGRRLFISEETVKTHLRRVRHKLGVENPRDYRHLRRRLEEFGLMEDES